MGLGLGGLDCLGGGGLPMERNVGWRWVSCLQAAMPADAPTWLPQNK